MRRPLHPPKPLGEDGVASTVGTIMALLVFLTFLSLITNQYVPVWMKDSEAAHMGEALGDLGGLKSNVDLQILAAQTATIVKRHYIPVTTFSSIKLGVDGVPIFSSPTLGDLRVNQGGAPWTIWFQYTISGNMTNVPEANCDCGGHVRLNVFNRYYVQQSVAYENGALIRGQQDGQVVKGEPSFQILVSNNSVQVDYTLIQLFGAGGVAGVGTEGIQARVIGVDLQEYANIQTAIMVNATSLYGPAWYRLFNHTLANAYGIDSDYYDDFPAESDLIADYDASNLPIQLTADNPIYRVQSLWDDTLKSFKFTLTFKRDVGGDSINVLPVSAFRLLHAFVNVAVGEGGNVVGI